MDIYLTRTIRSLEGADEHAKEAMRRWKIGETLRCTVKKPRSYRNHKRYFALITIVWENLPEQYHARWPSMEVFRKAVQIAAGHVDEIITLDGEVQLIPRSIAYDSLDEMEFSKVFSETMVVCAKLLGDAGMHELEEEVMRAA